MTSQITAAPELRFPEFEDEWEIILLDKITKWTSGGTPSKTVDEYWDGEIPWISASSMRGLKYYDSNIKITPEGLKNGSRLAKKGSLLLLVRGSMLFKTIPIGIAMRDLAFNQDVKAIEIDSSANLNFVLQWFISFENKLLSLVTGTGIGAGKLDLQELKSIQLSLPSLPEQTKIASFLSAVDEKIQALTKKKALLETYKKGVMQQLFSQELRFKDDDGNDFPDWEEKELGEVITNIQSGKDRPDANGDYNLYGSTGIIGKCKIPSQNGMFVLIARVGANAGLLNLVKGEFGVTDNTLIVSFKKNINTKYMLNLLENENLNRLAFGSGQPLITGGLVKKILFFLPAISEQTKIANFLTGLDEKLNKLDQQITAMQTFKKGLLQQMFV